MVALRWCEQDEAEQQQQAVGRLAGAGSPSVEPWGCRIGARGAGSDGLVGDR